MIILNSTDNIQVKLSGSITTNQLECFSSYRDTTTTTITPGRNFLNTNNTTAVNLVGSPAVSTQRVVDYFSIYNADTVSATVTVQFDVSGTPYTLIVATLLTGEKLEYQEGRGFRSLSSIGGLKQGIELGYNDVSGASFAVLASDVTNSNATLNTIADVTGLSFAVTSGKTYWFRFVIPYTSAALTTGSRWSINGPAITLLYYESNYNLQYATVGTPGVLSQNYGLTAYDNPAVTNASSNLSGNLATIEGILIPSATGTLIARFASEIANSAITAKAGAVVFYKQLD